MNSINDNYILVNSQLTFHSSEQKCKSLFDSSLASIHSDNQLNEINLLIQSYSNSNLSISTNTNAWIGLTDEYLENHYIWIGGQTLNYSSNIYQSHNNHFDCISIHNLDTIWYPQHCKQQYIFICNAHSYWTKPIDFSFLPPITPYNESINGIYVGYNIKTTYVAADAYCQRLHGTHLATITNDINAIDAQSLCLNNNCWIGLNRIYTQRIWKWIDTYTVNNNYYRWKLNTDLDYDCVYIHNNIHTIYSWSTYPCYNNSNIEMFLCNKYPQNSLSGFPTNYPSTAPTIIDNEYINMIEMDGYWDCFPLTDSIQVIYGNSYDNCIFNECLYNEQCKMVNYIPNSKTLTDSRCYIFNKQCVIKKNENNEKNKIVFKGFNDFCVDYPINWIDKENDKCFHYETFEWCIDKQIHYNVSIDEFITHTDHIYNLNAIQVCCECGGGQIIFDNVTFVIAVSIEEHINNPLQIFDDNICEWKYDYLNGYDYKYWNNLDLYNLCNILYDKVLNNFNFISINELLYMEHENDINCDILIDQTYSNNNDNVIVCDFNDYDSTKNNTYFILLIAINSLNQTSTIYLNSQWFNITNSLLFKPTQILPYSQCIISLQNTQLQTSYALYGIKPCDIYPIPIHITNNPSNTPTFHPTKFQLVPTFSIPTYVPSIEPSHYPSYIPTNTPSLQPTYNPTTHTLQPTMYTIAPTSKSPTNIPTINPINTPTNIPSIYPSNIPTITPTNIPTIYPSNNPTNIPSNIPSIYPTNPTKPRKPTLYPTNPTKYPTEYNTEIYVSNENISKNDMKSTSNNSLFSVFIIITMTLLCMVLCSMTLIGVFCWGKFKLRETERNEELSRIQFEIATYRQSQTTNDINEMDLFELTSDLEIETKQEEECNQCMDNNDIEHFEHQCIICLINTPNMFNYPCGHCCFCDNCASTAISHDDKCPNCREIIIECKQIYNAGFQE